MQLPHARPSTSAREDADADALECDAGWADEEIVILPSLALGFGDIKLTHYPLVGCLDRLEAAVVHAV